MTPTPQITPAEASMAFHPTNCHLGDAPASFVGHRGKVYIAWVTEMDLEEDTFLGLYKTRKECKRAIHK
eukprot:9472503-Ditylum_brightwellii.AAC.1